MDFDNKTVGNIDGRPRRVAVRPDERRDRPDEQWRWR
jgi:hypothetical protein